MQKTPPILLSNIFVPNLLLFVAVPSNQSVRSRKHVESPPRRPNVPLFMHYSENSPMVSLCTCLSRKHLTAWRSCSSCSSDFCPVSPRIESKTTTFWKKQRMIQPLRIDSSVAIYVINVFVLFRTMVMQSFDGVVEIFCDKWTKQFKRAEQPLSASYLWWPSLSLHEQKGWNQACKSPPQIPSCCFFRLTKRFSYKWLLR